MNLLPEALGGGLLVGLALGLTGGGGSILAVPYLLYILGFDLRAAVKISLAVVGLTSSFGAVMQRREVVWKAGAVLGAGGIFGAPLGAWLGTQLPETLVLLLFAALMIFISLRFLRGGGVGEVPISRFGCAVAPGESRPRFHWSCAAKLLVAGSIAGVLAGLFGVGGGFILVPALMMVARLSLTSALSTSLLSISILSAVSFSANAGMGEAVNWPLTGIFLIGAFLGMIGGIQLKQHIPPALLRKIFALSVLAIAVAMIVKTLSGT